MIGGQLIFAGVAFLVGAAIGLLFELYRLLSLPATGVRRALADGLYWLLALLIAAVIWHLLTDGSLRWQIFLWQIGGVLACRRFMRPWINKWRRQLAIRRQKRKAEKAERQQAILLAAERERARSAGRRKDGTPRVASPAAKILPLARMGDPRSSANLLDWPYHLFQRHYQKRQQKRAEQEKKKQAAQAAKAAAKLKEEQAEKTAPDHKQKRFHFPIHLPKKHPRKKI